jgi:hypothetical protein
MPPKSNSGVIKLRNAMSNVLYEHKEEMPDGVYKKLYETLSNETRQTLNKRWVKLGYIYASGIVDLDAMEEEEFKYPMEVSQTYRTRNIQLTTDAIDRITEQLEKEHFARFKHIIPEEQRGGPCTSGIYAKIANELDEKGCFCHQDKSYMIIKMTILE